VWVRALLIGIALLAAGCGDERRDVLTFSGSALGREGDVLRAQLARFSASHGIPVEIRSTPDSADQRHQLYVQWLNAHAADPDVLQLDVVWTPEFAAAGWLLPFDRFGPSTDDFFPATIAANRWNGRLFGLPWFVDVGMLYWRTDLLDRAPSTFDELTAAAQRAIQRGAVRHGLAWQAARYEGLITVFVEVLGGFGGRILDDEGAVVVDADPAVRALTWMRDAIHRDGIVPSAALTWQEEQARFAFQNGTAAMMRNWPYAFALLQAPDSPVAGRFAVSPMPATPDGEPTAALGGSQLAINARTSQPDHAWALVQYLTAPEQMIERARVVGQFPSRRSPYRGTALEGAVGIDPAEALRIVEAAEARPVTPVYTQLSEILQIRLHRVLTLQQEPRAALEDAAREMRALLARVGL
jgi:ABC-type glycerol-3-phosphate transport system substrate-binding protein